LRRSQAINATSNEKKKDDMTTGRRRAFVLATLFLLPVAPAIGATPAPKQTQHKPITLPTPHYPMKKLHTEFVVEVNAKGQVVRVKSGKSCDNYTFNAQTYGNVLQMWIRHPDGSADVGLYRVTYDYDPKTRDVHRGISLVQKGGTWGDKEGAATEMIDTAKKETQEQKEAIEKQNKNLPSLQNIIKATPTPASTPHP
jgi:hypothetical protein